MTTHNSHIRKFPNAFVEAGVKLEHSVTIGPGAVILQGSATSRTVVRSGVSVGANATIVGGVELGEGCVVEPGSVVHQNVPARVVVSGNPAAIVGYASARAAKVSVLTTQPTATDALQSERALLTNGARLVELPIVSDLRGSLSAGEVNREIPFVPSRYFLVFDVPTVEVRGEHAHYSCHQFLVCIAGHCSAVVDDGMQRHEVLLERKTTGLYMPPMTWGVQYRYSRDAILMVLASHAYDAADYIRDYNEFLALVLRGSQ